MITSLCRFKFRRGKEADRKSITPEEGEPVFSTDVGRLAIGDGETPGGVPINKTWNNEPYIDSYAISGDVKLVDDKSYVYDGTKWIQTGGDGLITAISPLTASNNEISLKITNSYQGSNVSLNKSGEYGLYVDSSIVDSEISDINSDITNINSYIDTLSGNRIYNSISPMVLGYSAVYSDTVEEVPPTDLNSIISSSTDTYIGKVNNRDYKIDHGVKLLYTDNFTVTPQNVSYFVYNRNAQQFEQITKELPHLDIANGSITAAKIGINSITAAKIVNGNITTNKIADRNVTTNKLADESVTTDKIADESVTEIKLANNSVTKDKIADGSVTAAKLNTDVFTASIPNNTVTTDKIVDRAITGSKLDTNTGYLVESWSDTYGNWARKYSDGWIEQGGVYNRQNYWNTISFHFDFSNTNYILNATVAYRSDNSDFEVQARPYDTQNFEVFIDGDTYSIYWYACGY